MRQPTRADLQAFAEKYHGITLQPHQLRWISFMLKPGKRKILLAPRGHGKTTIVNLVYLSWLIAHDPQIHILLVSHSKEMAEAFSRSVRAVFEREEILQDFGIEMSTPWRANSWTLKGSLANKPTVRVVGVMGRMTGWRGDVVIFDDVLEIVSVSSEITRKKIKAWIDTEVLPAINPGKKERVIVVGTRKHMDDWYGELLQNPNYQKRVDKAIQKNGQVLWPERFDMNTLMTRREEIGSLRFNQEYQNEPSPPEGLEFKYEWLQFYEHLPTDRPLKYYMGIDPSHGSKSDRAGWYAYTIVAYDSIRDKIYIVEMYRNKLSQDEQALKSIEVAAYYKLDGIYVENVFNYTHCYRALKERFSNVYPKDYIHTKIKGTSAVNKEERIKNICAPAIERGRILFKEPSKDTYMKTFIEHEYIAFPLGDNDMLDSLTLAIHHLVKRQLTEVPFYFPK